jgi:hypothetical protein
MKCTFGHNTARPILSYDTKKGEKGNEMHIGSTKLAGGSGNMSQEKVNEMLICSTILPCRFLAMAQKKGNEMHISSTSES